MLVKQFLSLIIASQFLYISCGQFNSDPQGAFYTGQYRNLFLENGHSPEEINLKINTAFRLLFHGDSATQRVYFETGSNEKGPLAYVSDVLHNDVRSEGIYNYKAWADKILTAVRHHPIKRGMTRFGPRVVGPMVEEDKYMIRFVPDSGSWGFTDPSYHLPAFYDLWALWGPEQDRDFWARAAITSRDFFHLTTHPETGLAPDYANFDGTPYPTPWNQRAGNFSFDARRTQMNWAVDWSWWRKDPRQQELSNRLQSFFASQGIDKYGTQYTLDGQLLDSNHAKGLVATNAVVSLAATNPVAKEFTEALWNTPIPLEFNERYYDGLLYLMGMLHCSGEFRIWHPEP